MAKRDLKSNIDVVMSLPAFAATVGTFAGAGVDLSGFDSAMVVFSLGTNNVGTATPSMTESVDGTTYTAVGTGDLQGSFTAVTNTTADLGVQRVGYIGSKRYIAANLIYLGTGTMPVAADVVRGHPARKALA